jgi:WD40 repeat protein
VKLWDAATGRDVFTLRGAAARRPGDFAFLPCVAFSPDGTSIAANNWDGTINVWDTGDRAPELTRGLSPQ